jgi:predicted histidine transporter YuiF (NhaC family)
MKIIDTYFYLLFTFWRESIKDQTDKNYIIIDPLWFAKIKMLLPMTFSAIFIFLALSNLNNSKINIEDITAPVLVVSILSLIVFYWFYERNSRYKSVIDKYDSLFENDKINIKKKRLIALIIALASIIAPIFVFVSFV